MRKKSSAFAAAKAELVQVRAVVSSAEALISALKLEIAKLKREQYGTRSERSARLIDQLELQLEELEASATEDEIMADKAIATALNPPLNDRRRPSRTPFPKHLPRERVVMAAPAACSRTSAVRPGS
jgi:transposase